MSTNIKNNACLYMSLQHFTFIIIEQRRHVYIWVCNILHSLLLSSAAMFIYEFTTFYIRYCWAVPPCLYMSLQHFTFVIVQQRRHVDEVFRCRQLNVVDYSNIVNRCNRSTFKIKLFISIIRTALFYMYCKYFNYIKAVQVLIDVANWKE